MASKKIKLIMFGVGSIGVGIARVFAARPDYQFVGALDLDPAHLGQDLGTVIGLTEKLGVRVSDSSRKVLALPADLVIHATGSYFLQVKPQLEAIVKAGHNVVSTCEELADPWAQHPRAANELDKLAKENNVRVIGTGINPGFAMDFLPVALSAACQSVRHVRARRVVDASKRRIQLQKKIGTGLTAAAFAELASSREVRHVGLTESAALIARGLGWKLDTIEEQIAPKIAKTRVVTDFYTVEPNFVTGVIQTARGIQAGEERILLELEMAVDAHEAVDEVWIDGHPSLHSVVHGIHGDLSTAAVIANVAPRILSVPPGLLTMIDLPVPGSR